MIPYAIEAAVQHHAATLAFRDGRWGGRRTPTFEHMAPVDREPYVGNARRDLEAALPYLLGPVAKHFEDRAITAAYADNERAERIWMEAANYLREELGDRSSVGTETVCDGVAPHRPSAVHAGAASTSSWSDEGEGGGG